MPIKICFYNSSTPDICLTIGLTFVDIYRQKDILSYKSSLPCTELPVVKDR